MRRLAVVSLLMPLVLAAPSAVDELKKIVLAHDTDSLTGHKMAQVRVKERLSSKALAELGALKLGPRAGTVLDLLADESEFQPASPDSSAPLSAAEAEDLLVKTRRFAANYIQNLPNFLCTAILRRFDSPLETWVDNHAFLADLRLQDTTLNEVSFDHGRDAYRTRLVNGLPPKGAVQGFTTSGEFGAIFGSILIDDNHPRFARWESIDGRRVAVFHYAVDAAHSHYAVKWLDEKQRARQALPAFSGELSLDPVTGSIVLLTRHAVLPKDSRILYVDTAVEYEAMLIGDASYICPVKSVTRSFWRAAPRGFVFSVNEVRFGLYHKFEGESKLAFDEPAPASAPQAAPAPAPPPPVAQPEDPPVVPAVALPPERVSAPTILRSSTRLVEVSAIVLDQAGNAVTGLTKDDFQIFDNGRPETVRMFSAPAGRVAATDSPAAPMEHAARVFTNKVSEGTRAANPVIVLMDEGVADMGQRMYARDRLVRFLREAKPEDRIGLYVPIEDGVGIVREFTSDASALASLVQNWGIGAQQLQEVSTVAQRNDRTSRLDEHFCAAAPALTAIAASAAHVAGIPGRKTLIWFSDGSASGAGPQNCFAQEKDAQQALNRAGVTLYAIDTRGVESVQPDASIGVKDYLDPLRRTSGGEKPSNGSSDAQQAVANLNQMVRTNLDVIEKDQTLLLDLAEKAGGRAFFNNDTLGALRTSYTDSDAAYTLGFYPESPKADGSYHRLEVKVPRRPELTVRYRQGYVDESSDPKAQLSAALWSPIDSSVIALTAELDGDKVKLNIGIDAVDVQQIDGRWQGKLHVLVAQRDAEGKQYDYRDDTLKLDLKPDTYEAMLKTGLTYRQTLQAKREATSLRIIVRDESGNLGSVTVPLERQPAK